MVTLHFAQDRRSLTVVARGVLHATNVPKHQGVQFLQLLVGKNLETLKFLLLLVRQPARKSLFDQVQATFVRHVPLGRFQSPLNPAFQQPRSEFFDGNPFRLCTRLKPFGQRLGNCDRQRHEFVPYWSVVSGQWSGRDFFDEQAVLRRGHSFSEFLKALQVQIERFAGVSESLR